ncbi:MAG: ArsR/SmtB family transcription factor [Bacillota bacterium]
MCKVTLLLGEDILRALADHTRIRIVKLLLLGSEPCVCELVDSLRLPQHTVSRHLSILKKASIVKERREGTWRYYYLSPDTGSFVGNILAVIRNDFNDKLLELDMKLYKQRLDLRENGKCVIGLNGNSC